MNYVVIVNGSQHRFPADSFHGWLRNRGERVSTNVFERAEQLNRYWKAIGRKGKVRDWEMEDSNG